MKARLDAKVQGLKEQRQMKQSVTQLDAHSAVEKYSKLVLRPETRCITERGIDELLNDREF